MKTLLCWTALFGVTLGFASAGPVAPSGGNASACDMKCRSPYKFKYSPGKSYDYSYSTKTETALEQSSDEKSTIYLDADISLHVIDSCRFSLKINSAKLDEEVSGGGRKPSRGTQKLAESLTKNPLVFNFDDGMVTRLCPAVHESKSTLNIKRGILSMIHNQMAEFDDNDFAVEDDVLGRCLAAYRTSKDWAGQITILKKKSLSECKRDDGQQVVSAIALPHRVAKSSSIINGTQECQQVIKNSVYVRAECRERHVVKPFSRQEKGAATEIYQSLQLMRAGANIPTDALRYTEGEEQTLRFEYLDGSETTETEERAKSILQRLSGDKEMEIEEKNDRFSALLELVRKMRYDTLKKLWSELQGNSWFFDALTNTMTGDAMKLVAELIKGRHIATHDAKLWLVKVAMATDIDASRISLVKPLLDMDDIVVEAHLAVSSMARTFMEENPSNVPQEVNELLTKFFAQLKSGTPDELLMATIKAIGNLGISNGQESKLLEVTAQRSREVRLAALEAFRRFPCDKVDRQILMNVFTQKSENIEVRIAAYLNAIMCPTEKMLATVRDVLLNEPKDSQMASFVFTHIKNLAKRSSFHEDLSSITEDETLSLLELDTINYSKNYFYEMFFTPLDMGFELDAGAILSDEIHSFMLNSTFDIFGHKVNMFDSKVRLHKDMSQLDGFVRFFGKEVFYKKMNKQSRAQFDTLLKSVMSPTGWKFTRSMMLLDSEMTLPTGNGLPLTVAVNSTATLALDLKAMPLQGQQGSKFVAEARSAPSLAVRFGISMMTKTPQATSGIKMVVTASSQWELNGSINIDLTDSRMVRNIQIAAPRERSDLIDVKSNVYLVGSNAEHEVKATGSRQKQWEMCTGQNTHILVGHKACLNVTYPEATGADAPFVLLRGPNRFSLRLIKTDQSLNLFKIQSSFHYGPGELLELTFVMDTPNSKVDRHFKGRLYSDFRNKKFGIDMISPLKSVNLEGTYQLSPTNKRTQFVLKVDGNSELTVIGGTEVANGRIMIMSPFLEIHLRDRQILLLKSQIATQGTQKYNGDVEIHSIFNKDHPIKLIGEYSTINDKQRVNFGLGSQWLQYNMQSSLTKNVQGFDVGVEGDYTYNGGSKHTFKIGGKFFDDGETLAAEASVERNGVSFGSGRAKVVRRSPVNFDLGLDLFQGRIRGALSLETENQRTTLTAMAEKDKQKYTTLIKFFLQPASTSIAAKFQLPDNVERMAQLQYDLGSPVKRFVVETDLLGKTYSARMSYVPSQNLHKINANAKLDTETVQLAAALGIDSVYQAKVDITHNRAKILATSLGVSQDMSKPNVRVYAQYRERVLVDLLTDTVIEPRMVSMGLTMRAPIELNANTALKSTGSLSDTLRVEAEIDVRSQDQAINFGWTSMAEISLWQRSNKVNFETTIKAPAGTTTFISNNVLDASSWSVDWRLQTPNQEKQHLLSSGTYMLDPSKIHLRGVFEMDIRPLGERIVVEPVVLDTELTMNSFGMDFRSELTKNTKATIFLLGVKASNQRTQKHLSAELNIMDLVHHVQLTIDGHDLHSGWRASLDSRWQDKTAVGKSILQWDGENVYANLDLQTSFGKPLKAKLLLKTQTVGQDSKVINAEYVLGEHFGKAEINTNRNTFEGEVRTSIEDWQNLKARASWRLEPEMILIVEFSSPKFENNVLEFRVQRENGVNARGRLTVPSLHRGDFLEGNLRYSAGKGKLSVSHRGQQKADLLFNVKNEEMSKELSGSLSYDMDGTSNVMNVALGIDKNAANSYETKMSLFTSSKRLLDVAYRIALRTDNGIFAEHQMEYQTSLSEEWPSAYLLNKLIVSSDSVRTQHEFGTSQKDVLYGVDVSGRLNDSDDMFAMEGKLDGRWGRTLKGSVSAEITTDKKNNISWETRADSDQTRVFSTKWDLIRHDRLVELRADWEAPKMQQEGVLEMRSGFESDAAFVFAAKLDRNRDTAKTTEVSLRLPLRTQNIDGHLKVIIPEELGGQALKGTLMAKESMFDANAEFAIDGGRQAYAAEAASKWDQDFTFNGMLRKNNDNIVKADLKASWRRPEAYELSAEVMRRDVSYKANLNGAWTRTRGEVSMEAESSEWKQKHSIRGSYSTDSKIGDLKMDIADLKVNINALMSGTYKIQGSAKLNGEPTGELKLNFNPDTKQGDIEAEWDAKRLSTTFVVRFADGEVKMQLPSGSSALNWSMDNQNKLSVRGHWTFRNENWRLELTADPRVARELVASLYHKNERVGNLHAQYKPDAIDFKFELDYNGKKHSAQVAFHNEDGMIGGVFKMSCPWISTETVESEVAVKYSQAQVDITSKVKIGSQLHTVMVKGNIAGGRILGSVEIRCPWYGDLDGQLEGVFNENGFNARITSAKLKQPAEVTGGMIPGKIHFALKFDGYEAEGNVYTRSKYGFELFGKTDRAYKISAVLDAPSSMTIIVQTPWIAKTGIYLARNAGTVAGYEVEGDWLGRRILHAGWAGTDNTMLKGVFNGDFDLDGGIGKHNLVVTYSFLGTPSLEVKLDGQRILVGIFDKKNQHLSGKLTMKSVGGGDLTLDFEHRLNEDSLSNSLKLSQNGKTLGYEMRLHKDILGSMLRIDTPRRNVLMELEDKQPSGSITGRLAWDHGRDQKKTVEVSLKRNSNFQGAGKEHHLTLSIPKLDEKVIIRIAQTKEGLEVELHDEKRSPNLPRMNLMYSKAGKLRMHLGNLMMQAEISSKKSELIVRRLSTQFDEINIGYNVQGNTFSARLTWNPRLLVNHELAVKNMIEEIQKGHDNKPAKLWMRIRDFAGAELQLIGSDVRSMIEDLKSLYEQNAWHLKTIFGSAVRAGNYVARVMESISEEVSATLQRTKKIINRYSQRLTIVSTVVSAMQQEIVEDLVDAIERWLNQFERSISNVQMRNFVQRVRNFVRREYKTIVDAIDYVADEYVCEISNERAHINNKRCGFAYKLDSQNKQHGLMMRVPVIGSQSS